MSLFVDRRDAIRRQVGKVMSEVVGAKDDGLA